MGYSYFRKEENCKLVNDDRTINKEEFEKARVPETRDKLAIDNLEF